MSGGFVALFVAVGCLLLGTPAGADPVVEREVAAANGDDGEVTADIKVLNTGPRPLGLAPVAVPPVRGCLVTADPTSVAASQWTTVTITLTQACFADDSRAFSVDLDGVGSGTPLPATIVTAPKDEASDWTPLWLGIILGLFMAVPVGLWGVTEHQKAQESLGGDPPPGTPTREESYRAVQAVVDARVADLAAPRLDWKPFVDLDPPIYTWRSPVANLEAGWSFKDSWVSNITVASTALIALLTSTDALTAVLGEEPAAALGVMTVGGLVAAVLIGIANTVVKLIGRSVAEVTVGGLILSTAIVVLAAGLEVATVAVAVAEVVVSWPVAVAALAFGAVVAAVLVVYAFRSLGQAILGGVTDSLPVVPPGAVTAWAASEDWEKVLVTSNIRETYADWLVGGSVPTGAGPAAASLPAMGRPVWVEQVPASLL